MSAPKSAGTEGWLALEPIKHNGKHYPQHAVLSRDELDQASADRLILSGVIDVAEWVDEQLPVDPDLPVDPELPVVESASPETAAALDVGEVAVTRRSKTKKPSKPAKASQE